MPTLQTPELLLIVLPLLLWLLCIIDVIRSDFTASNKMVWLLVLLLLSVFGCIPYLIFRIWPKIQKRD